MNELDRILMADVGPQPTADFSRRVMTTVRAERRAGGLSRTWLLVLTGMFVVLSACLYWSGLPRAFSGSAAKAFRGGSSGCWVYW